MLSRSSCLRALITNMLADACPEGSDTGGRQAAPLIWRSECNSSSDMERYAGRLRPNNWVYLTTAEVLQKNSHPRSQPASWCVFMRGTPSKKGNFECFLVAMAQKTSRIGFKEQTTINQSESSCMCVRFCPPLMVSALLAMLSLLCHRGQQLVMANTSHALATATVLYLGIHGSVGTTQLTLNTPAALI